MRSTPTREAGEQVERTQEVRDVGACRSDRGSLCGVDGPASAGGHTSVDQYRHDYAVCGDLRCGRFRGDCRVRTEEAEVAVAVLGFERGDSFARPLQCRPGGDPSGGVREVFAELDHGAARDQRRADCGDRREDAAAQLRRGQQQIGHSHGQRLGHRQPHQPGPGRGGREEQRDHGHPEIAANAGAFRVFGDDRCDGLPDGDC